jgi:general stress protein 26
LTTMNPVTTLGKQFSSPEASARPWSEAVAILEEAQIFWLSTVRPDGRPHVTPLIAVWLEGAIYFCTGASERKAKNIAHNSNCILTTGCNRFEGFDLVVEGKANNISNEDKLKRTADRYLQKYGEEWRFEVRDGAFIGDGNRALVFEVAPITAFGFGKDEPFSQTKWSF